MTLGSYCYWMIGDGDYARMISGCVASARAVGVKEDFHVWTPLPIKSAVHHACSDFSKQHYWFKFDFLQKHVRNLDYTYYVFLDADTWFVRNPGNLVDVLHGAPVHVCLESDCSSERNKRDDWWGCPLPEYCSLLRGAGVREEKIYNTNAGFWIVHRDCVITLCGLAKEFWDKASEKGYVFTEEAPLAYAGQMLMADLSAHTLQEWPHLWASDWTGVFEGQLPVDRPWEFVDYMSGATINVRPAIVHAMRSKREIVKTVLQSVQEN